MRPATGALQLGEFEVEQRLPHRGGQRRHRRLGDALRLGALVERLLGDGALLDELGAAGEVGLGEGEVGLRLLEIGLAPGRAWSGTAACRW